MYDELFSWKKDCEFICYDVFIEYLIMLVERRWVPLLWRICLQKDGEFVYPDLFDRDSSTYRDTMEAKNEADAKNRVKRAQNIDTQDLPPWFR